MSRPGLVHLYCGDGKGKTTAALGLLLRATGAGLRVVLVQFLKGEPTAELAALARLETVTVLRGTVGTGWRPHTDAAQQEAARACHDQSLAEAEQLVLADACDLLILDEAAGACRRRLVDEARLRRLVEQRPAGLEVVLTGRRPPDWMLQCADYVTEMQNRRHPHDRGVPARVGIER